jgi:triosephosphate isomerase
MRKLIIANWKENPVTEQEATALFRGIAKAKRGDNVDVVICPPTLYLVGMAKLFQKLSNKKNLALGAQDIFWEETGAFTGQVGPKMIQALGVSYVILGHSERRKWVGETDDMVNKKLLLALEDGLNVVLCVGESLAVQSEGIAAAKKFIKEQLKKDLANLGKVSKKSKGSLIVAYEPIWAIGTGKNADSKYAAAITDFIKKTVASLVSSRKIRVLYGGSVNSKNSKDYVQYKEVDGALVGGASLSVSDFAIIIK